MQKVNVWVKPGSSKGSLVQPAPDGSLLVYLREPAHEGKANLALIALIAKYYLVPKSSVTIVKGQASKQKLIRISTQVSTKKNTG